MSRALAVAAAVLLPLCLLACQTVVEITPIPAGFPLNACPVAGPGSVTPREGYRLVPPGEIVFAYETWHNETPDSFACGAQSITGGKAIVRPADYPSGLLPWVATYRRGVALQVADDVAPEGRLFRIAPENSSTLVETIGLSRTAPQFGTLSNLFEHLQDPAPGVYRLLVVSAGGEVLATGEFELRP